MTPSFRAKGKAARPPRRARRLTLLLTAVLTVAAIFPFVAQGATWLSGDVFAGVGSGQYKVYDNAGTFKETISQAGAGGVAVNATGFTTGCAFNPVQTHLYTTNFSNEYVVRFQDPHPHTIDQNILTSAQVNLPFTGAGDLAPESVVFAADGSFYVGHADGTDDLHKYDAAGTFLRDFNLATENRGSDWNDLAADQATMFYTSEGRQVKRYNVATDTQLADFATVPGVFPVNILYALRLLPPGDGSGGLLVADQQDVKRLNGAGAVVQMYDVAGENAWFSLNLDPNGTSFWAGDFGTNNFYRFNIATGAIEVGPINTGVGTQLFGLCLKGEPTAAAPRADKEVEDIILDDGSGFPDSEGPPLALVSRDNLTRTSTYKLQVQVSTNPIISVVSLERNNGPDETDSDITFLASIDDNHAPGHVEGAYIRDAGSPKGSAPDLLTCFSLVNPDNPLEQRLNPCPTEEKIPGDGDPRTVESDLHFQLVQEANQRLRILRFFKLHCLEVGSHSITFYNKAEPKDPTEDPDLSNNWWRAILQLECVPGAPATLTLEPKTDVNPVDTEHCVTATVKDAFGNPTPGITVRFHVTGSDGTMIDGSATTDANGQAKFCYDGPALPRTDVIDAYADTNNNNVRDPGEPFDVANKEWVLPVTTPGCVIKITNGGWIIAMNGDRSSFGGNAKADAEGNVSGNEEYQDHGPAEPFNLHGNVLAIVCGADGKSGTVFGTATIDGEEGSPVPYFYRIDVVDNGEPGNKPTDTYQIRVTKPYDSGNQPLRGGNIQVHRSA